MSEPPLHTPETGTRASSFEPLTPPASSNHRMIVEQREFDDYCAELESAEAIAFDTEFVSEDCYRPDLCLIQVATQDGLVVFDPKPLDSVDRFWQVIIEGDHETIVHSGREELRFCLHATEALPKKLIDVQLAAGRTGVEYPAAYRTLVHKLVHVELSKAETRTNWRARPLTEGQIGYALTDVDHLIPLRNELFKRLARLDRVQCSYEETEIWARGVQRAEMVDPWRRVGGSGGLNPKGLAIVKAVWEWREETASRRNCPARRVLRDDLVVELAKRSSHNLSKIKNIRGFDRGDLKRHLDEISSRIESVLNSSPTTWPGPVRTFGISSLFASVCPTRLQSRMCHSCRDGDKSSSPTFWINCFEARYRSVSIIPRPINHCDCLAQLRKSKRRATGLAMRSRNHGLRCF